MSGVEISQVGSICVESKARHRGRSFYRTYRERSPQIWQKPSTKFLRGLAWRYDRLANCSFGIVLKAAARTTRPLLVEEQGIGCFIESPTARMLEAVRAAKSTRANHNAVFVLVVRDINAAARSNGSTGSP